MSTTDSLSSIWILTESLKSTLSALGSAQGLVLLPDDGISLLDVKNDLLLSYLHNLVFLILSKVRSIQSSTEAYDLASENLRKLIELRAYLEKGVRPLEGRLKYQIDKVVKASDDSERLSSQKTRTVNTRGVHNQTASDSELASDASRSESPLDQHETNDLSYRPNLSALVQNAGNAEATRNKMPKAETVYRPPKVTPTAMPTTQDIAPRSRDRQRRSHLLDEYVDNELSSQPLAQPSIGSNSTILARGRSSLTARDRAKEIERTDYEERNFVRLPAESKAARRKARDGGESTRDIFGGEDWTGLGGLGDRVVKSVSGQAYSRKDNIFERREKRRRATDDGPRNSGSGAGIGEAFEKRRKVLQDRAERKITKKRS